MIPKFIVLSDTISVVLDNILRIYIQGPLFILKELIVLLLYQDITVYLTAIKLTRLIPGNVFVQDECMMKPML